MNKIFSTHCLKFIEILFKYLWSCFWREISLIFRNLHDHKSWFNCKIRVILSSILLQKCIWYSSIKELEKGPELNNKKNYDFLFLWRKKIDEKIPRNTAFYWFKEAKRPAIYFWMKTPEISTDLRVHAS